MYFIYFLNINNSNFFLKQHWFYCNSISHLAILVNKTKKRKINTKEIQYIKKSV